MFAPFTAGNLQGLRKFELDRKKMKAMSPSVMIPEAQA
jgi:hypothetical protein